MSKLRNGHAVRIRKGEGCNVIVDPNTYNLVSRAFAKGSGIQIRLSPEEIHANREHSHKMEGTGIFGKKFDKALKKAGIKKVAYQVGDVAKPMVKKALNEAIDTGAEALTTYAPELAPVMPILTSQAKKHTGKFLDKPSAYTGEGFSGIKLRKSIHNLQEAGRDFADANDLHSRLSADSIKSRFGQAIAPGMGGSGLRMPQMLGRGMHSGYGGGYIPQAIVPQPYGANFHMKNMLPPHYQHYNDGTTEPGPMNGSGLYASGRAGRGLYA
jgi:hypothetical protein